MCELRQSDGIEAVDGEELALGGRIRGQGRSSKPGRRNKAGKGGQEKEKKNIVPKNREEKVSGNTTSEGQIEASPQRGGGKNGRKKEEEVEN